MFTIKHIRLSGEEDLYTSPTARYSPGIDNGTTGAPATVWYTKADGFEHPLTGGTVFVMNDAGKTVARYDIGASMVPLEDRKPREPINGQFLDQAAEEAAIVRAGRYRI
jgi:hypothetical protein